MQPTRPFAPEEYRRRTDAVRRALADRGWQALVLASPENVGYLSGLDRVGHFAFTALVVPADGVPVLVARAMEEPTVAAQAPEAGLAGYGEDESPAEAVERALKEAGAAAGRVGVEKGAMSFPPRVWEGIAQRTPGVTWEDGTGVVDEIAAVKSGAELSVMRHAALLADRAIQSAIRIAGTGVSEREIGAEASRTMLSTGSDYPGIPPLVRSMRTVEYEHLTAGDRLLESGDGLLLELSACMHRYHAPLTRTVHIGRVPAGAAAAAEISLEGLEAVRDALLPGARTGDAYAAWVRVLDRALGEGRYRRHNCGHLVGIGFPPGWFGGPAMLGLGPGGAVPVRPGMTFHIFSWLSGPRSPGDYVLSDTVVVTETGAQFLTSTDRGPRAVG